MDQYEHLRKFPLNVVLAQLGFETFKYRKAGTEGYGRCAICQPKKNTTAFSFNDDGRFHCFACGASGRGAIDLVKAVRQCGFQEATEWLKTLPGTPVKHFQEHQPALHVPSDAKTNLTENPPFKASYEKYFKPHAWLEARGLTAETLARYEVGYYENAARRSVYNGSVMLKIRRWSDGECVGYLSRNIGEITAEKPKYVFPKGVSKGLEVFGAIQLKEKAPLRVVFLVESPLCVLKFSQHGFEAVSPFGWSVSAEQSAILAHLAKGYIYLPDADKVSEIGSSLLHLARVCWVKTPALPADVSDPERLSVEQIRSLMTS